MHLEKLKIQGFKSFANKNELVFPGVLVKDKKGITCIVGPNGSGKSNVADAVRWALGEQSMKSLRGKKAEDIIFSGSDKKGKLGMAEVSLFLNNEDKRAPIDFTQIVITRRLYRDGNSEYMINNNRVRLTDIQMLLAKASFGQKTYSVIGQGMVEGFLSGSLAERKEFFDEATGVRQFQIKRDDSLNKLKSSLDNLHQAEMLIVEIEPRLKNLTRQVEKIHKREELEKELDELQLKYYRKAWHGINDELDKANNEYLEVEKEKKVKDEKIDLLNRDLEGIQKERAVNEEFDMLQANLSKFQFKKNGFYSQLKKIENWISIKSESVDELDTKALEEEKEKLTKRNEEVSVRISAIESDGSFGDKIREKENELRELRNEREQLVRQSDKLNAWLEMKLESIGQFDLSFLNNRKTEITRELAEIKEGMDSKESLVETKQAELNRFEIEKEEILEKVKEFNKALGEIKSLGNKRIVKEVNERLQNSLNKLGDAEKENDLEKVKRSLIEIKTELRKVLDFSTGQEAQSKQEEIQDELTKLIERREELMEKISGLRLEINTKKEENRLALNKEAQLKSELSENDVKIRKSQEKFDSSSVRKEIEEIEKKIKPIEDKQEGVKEIIVKLNSQQEESKDKIFGLRRELQEGQARVNEIANELNNYRVSFAKYETRLEDIEEALKRGGFAGEINRESIKRREDELLSEIRNIDGKISQDREKLNRFNQAQEEKRTHLLNLQRDLQVLQQEVNKLNISLNDIKVRSARHETRLEDLEAEIRQLYDGIGKIKSERVENDFDRDAVWTRIGQIRRQLDQIGGIDPEVEKEYKETKERFDYLSTQSSDLNNTINSLEGIVKELDETIKKRFDKEFKTISEKFEEYFKILFNGGNAKIEKVLASEKEVEESEGGSGDEVELSNKDKNMKKIKFLQKHNATGLAGIEIKACPPGKKISTISILSGGERALTAIALICAIISANPSPFVVLDEVDAALDEANSERLARILEELSHKTQFIAITHNRAPMRKANILYGVTMGDDGVSKLLSIKLDEAVSR